MSFTGSGTFVINSVGNPVVTTTVISSTWANALTADLATGLTNCITRDGQSPPTANIPLGGFKITNIGPATTTGDALSYGHNATVAALTATGTTTLATSLNGLLFATAGVVSTSASFSSTLTLAGSSTVPAAIITNIVEPETLTASPATGTIVIYPSTQSILTYTSASTNNFVLNVTWSAGTTMNTSLSAGQAVTVVFKNTNTATPHYCTSIQVDGTTSGVTTKWQGITPSSGNANSLDVYSITVTKTGSAMFNVLASLTPFV